MIAATQQQITNQTKIKYRRLHIYYNTTALKLKGENISMRTITKEYKILSYSELSEEAKKAARQWYLDSQDPYTFAHDLIADLEAETGFSNLRPYYSLGYCQGDGLCLAGHIDFEEIVGDMKKVFYKDFTIADYKALYTLKEYSRIDFNHTGHYYHKYSVDIDIYIDGCHSVKMYDFLEKTVNKLLKNIKEWYINTCDEYEKQGYSFFYEIEEEDLREYFECMEYEFYEDGTLFREVA